MTKIRKHDIYVNLVGGAGDNAGSHTLAPVAEGESISFMTKTSKPFSKREIDRNTHAEI